jgi:hypothetical protein
VSVPDTGDGGSIRHLSHNIELRKNPYISGKNTAGRSPENWRVKSRSCSRRIAARGIFALHLRIGVIILLPRREDAEIPMMEIPMEMVKTLQAETLQAEVTEFKRVVEGNNEAAAWASFFKIKDALSQLYPDNKNNLLR